MALKDTARSALERAALGRALLATKRNLQAERGARALEGCEVAFDDRSRGRERLCLVLAGYKEPIWGDVFGRLAAYLPAETDVCIMTSGLVSESLRALAADRGWSYLSTTRNHLSVVQNAAIERHPRARWIYKLDEDMFLTEGALDDLERTWREVEAEGRWEPAFVAPLINVNLYGHLRLLERLGLLADFRATGLTDLKVGDGLHRARAALADPRVAEYLWGSTRPELADIDALAARLAAGPRAYTVCPVRFSIGAILFKRELWEEFGGFPVTFVGSEFGLGDDEEFLCRYAYETARAMVVSENSLVGHLGYGGAQTARMLAYHAEHPERFACKRPVPGGEGAGE